jgi:hypothetical protein
MTPALLYGGSIAALLVIVAVIGAAYASARREALTLRAENARLWSFITTMRAVTIEPARRQEAAELVRPQAGEPLQEEPKEHTPSFRRYTEREVFDEEPDEPAEMNGK